MSRPLLQLALDHTSLEAAQRDVALLQDHVDIVEAGTILCLTEGLSAVKALRAQCPEKIIVADWKVADAGETLAQQAFSAGANWMTIICAVPRRSRPSRKAMPSRNPAAVKFKWNYSATGRWTTPETGIAPACVRRFTTADAMRRPAGNSGEKRT